MVIIFRCITPRPVAIALFYFPFPIKEPIKDPEKEPQANTDDAFWLKYMNGSTIKLNDMVRDCQDIKAKSGANSNPVTKAGIAAKTRVMSAVRKSAETNCQ